MGEDAMEKLDKWEGGILFFKGENTGGKRKKGKGREEKEKKEGKIKKNKGRLQP